jgi:hypothetical protein
MKEKVELIKKKLEEFHYWDARVISLECNYFGDEIILIYEGNEENVIYKFEGCYKVHFNHLNNYDKMRAVKNMSVAQIPYFLQHIEVSDTKEREFFSLELKCSPCH